MLQCVTDRRRPSGGGAQPRASSMDAACAAGCAALGLTGAADLQARAARSVPAGTNSLAGHVTTGTLPALLHGQRDKGLPVFSGTSSLEGAPGSGGSWAPAPKAR